MKIIAAFAATTALLISFCVCHGQTRSSLRQQSITSASDGANEGDPSVAAGVDGQQDHVGRNLFVFYRPPAEAPPAEAPSVGGLEVPPSDPPSDIPSLAPTTRARRGQERDLFVKWDPDGNNDVVGEENPPVQQPSSPSDPPSDVPSLVPTTLKRHGRKASQLPTWVG